MLRRSKLIIIQVLCLVGISTIYMSYGVCQSVEKDDKVQLVTEDIDRFWVMFDKAYPDFDPEIVQKAYLDLSSPGLKGFIKNRIRSAEYLSEIIKANLNYYKSIRPSTHRITEMEEEIKESFAAFAALYPKAEFPPVYFVVGAMNSGGTTSSNGLIIGVEMHGKTQNTPMDELGEWHQQVLKPVEDIPHIVAHELIHIQQKYKVKHLLAAALMEGSADFIAELISGEHINHHVHDFANSREAELWEEFKGRMLKKDWSGWLYSSQEGRPNDLGYWMGYQISKAYYDQASDKNKAIADILNIKDCEAFLAQSGYTDRFE